jgi:hypothetical protein
LDEIGKFEAQGGGHAWMLAELEHKEPKVVVLAVRREFLSAIEKLRGVRFDRVLDATDADLEIKLWSCLKQHEDWRAVGIWGGASGIFEATVGTSLHALQAPFRGQILSGVQAALLAHVGLRLQEPARMGWIGLIAAGLKSLSPAGNRLRPMLAISVQSCLFGMTMGFIRNPKISIPMGGALVGLWSFGQGLILQWLLVGNDLGRAYHQFQKQSGLDGLGLEMFLAGLAMLAALWGMVCAILGGTGRWKPWTRWSGNAGNSSKGRWISGLIVWLPVAVIAWFVWLATGDLSAVGWLVLRTVCVVWILWATMRSFRLDRMTVWMQKKGLWGPAYAAKEALKLKKGDGTVG